MSADLEIDREAIVIIIEQAAAAVVAREALDLFARVLEALASEAPEVPVRVVEASLKGQEVMDCAVEFAGELAAAPATVLLAPAAASMDQFRDYAERGECFAKAVRSRLGAEG